MNGNSKRDRVDSMIRRAVIEQIREVAFNCSAEDAAILRRHASSIQIGAAWNISGDPYRMKELQDVMSWKKAPKE